VMDAISELCQTHGAIEVRRATSAAEQEQLWSARRSAFQAFPALAPAFYLIDTVVPRTRLPEMMARVAELSERYQMPIANVFHAGDGNLHPLALYDPADPAQVATAHAISSEVLRLSLELGGTLSGEHGIGVEKQNYMTTLWGASELQALATVYQVFNPADRLNPGKVFPAGISPHGLALQRQERIAAGRQLIDGGVALEQQLIDAVGAAYVLANTASYAVQGHAPRYAVLPGSVEELACVMAICHRVGATVTPWGGGSQQSQGTVERASDVVVVTRRLNSVLCYEPDDLTIGVGAGTTLAALRELLAAHGQMLPLDAPLPERATLGVLVATATDGPRRLGYGTLRDLLLGLTIVEVDGTITRLGGQVVKNVSGFDLVRLMLGSHGTLGVIAEVRLRTLPLAPAESTLLATFRTRAAALAFSDALKALPLTPTAVEYLDGGALWHIGTVGGAGVAVRVEGVPASCARHMRDATGLARRHGAIETRELTGADHEELWAAVANLSATILAPGETLLRLAVAPADVGAALDDLETLLRRWGASVAVNARAHNGVIYARVRCPLELAQLQDALTARWRHSHVLATQHSNGEALRVWGAQPQGHALMRAIKQLFDPFETLNPDRYVV
jgi:D-lactate dehydrogenase (cytochrome)